MVQSTIPSTFACRSTRPEEAEVDVLFIPVFEHDDRLTDLPGLDEASGGEISRARSTGEFRAKLYDVFVTPVTGTGWKARRLALVGAGDPVDADAERLRRVAATCGYVARRRWATSIGWMVRRGLDGLRAAQCAADGLSAAEFDAGVYKQAGDPGGAFPATVEIVAPDVDPAALREAVRRGRVLGESANFARALSNEPGNVLTPREFAARVSSMASSVGLGVEILDDRKIKELGMSPLPSNCSAPLLSRIVRESTRVATRKASRAGRFALMRPVMTSTDGRWVARIKWIPTARAICARRAIDSSTSLLAAIIRSASSSMITTTYGRGFRSLPSAAFASGDCSAIAAFTFRLNCSMFRTP